VNYVGLLLKTTSIFTPGTLGNNEDTTWHNIKEPRPPGLFSRYNSPSTQTAPTNIIPAPAFLWLCFSARKTHKGSLSQSSLKISFRYFLWLNLPVIISKITDVWKTGRKTLPSRTVGVWEDNIKMDLEVGCESVESNNLAWEWD